MWVVSIAVWDAWLVVATLWGARTLLGCATVWAAAPTGGDWRARAWRCQWQLLRYLGALLGSAATLQLAGQGGGGDAAVWLLVLVLVGCRALLDLGALAAPCWRLGPPLREWLRWRGFLLRLRWRRLAPRGARRAPALASRSLFLPQRPGPD